MVIIIITSVIRFIFPVKYTAVSYIYVHSMATATAPLLSAPMHAVCSEARLLLHDKNAVKTK